MTQKLNQYQINLIKDWSETEQDNLHDQIIEWGQGVPEHDEAHLKKYGTTSYEEAQMLIEDIRNQLSPESEEDGSLFPEPVEVKTPIVVGWVKHCEGRLLQIGHTVSDVSKGLGFLHQDTWENQGKEYDCVSLQLPGPVNSWETLNDCIDAEYNEYEQKTTYFFVGEIADKLRDLFSIA